MKEVIIFLSMFGCDDSAKHCEHIDVKQPLYRTEAECLAASEALFAGNIAAEYPTLLVRCDNKAPANLSERPNAGYAADLNTSEHAPVQVEIATNMGRSWLGKIAAVPVLKAGEYGAGAGLWILASGQSIVRRVSPF